MAMIFEAMTGKTTGIKASPPNIQPMKKVIYEPEYPRWSVVVLNNKSLRQPSWFKPAVAK